MQKLYISIAALLFAGASLLAQHLGGISYTASLPQGEMRNGWSSGHGMGFSYLHQLKPIPFIQVGADMQYGIYASQNKPHQFRFGNGDITNTTATLTSSLFSIGLVSRIVPLHSKRVSPYAELKGGYLNMGSRIFVEDPTDVDGCRALENRNIIRSGSLYGGGGLGVLYDIGKQKGQSFLSLEASTVFGGLMEYANMNRLYHDHTLTDPTTREADKNERPLNVTFINVTTNERHEHSIAEVYTHPLRMWQFQLKYIFNLDRK